jgi:hypothetical protein
MEPRFGQDFSHVRVHTDAKADESARSVRALAYTVGRDVVFAGGHYAPDTHAGQRLLAHELTHTIQQGGVAAGEPSGISQPGDASEREADQVSQAVVQQDVSNKPINSRSQQRLGGESETESDEQGLMGGESALATVGTLQRQGGAAAAPATLDYTTVKPRTRTSCGGFEYAVKWKLDGATASTNGFVVQKLTFDLNREICAGGRDDFQKTYWEAWQVRGGNIFIGTSNSAHNADTFRVNATPDEKGINFEEGNAKYIDGYTDPLTWGNVPEAGNLPATTTQPAGWSDSGTFHRDVKVTFDCCEQTDLGVDRVSKPGSASIDRRLIERRVTIDTVETFFRQRRAERRRY